MPPALETEPELWAENFDYLQAFYDLSRSRQIGMGGPMAIAINEIEAYCQMFKVDDVREFFQRIRAADSAYLDWQNSRAGK